MLKTVAVVLEHLLLLLNAAREAAVVPGRRIAEVVVLVRPGGEGGEGLGLPPPSRGGEGEGEVRRVLAGAVTR